MSINHETEEVERVKDRRVEKMGAPGESDRREAFADRRHENNRQYVTFFLEDHYLGVEVEKVQEVFTTREMTGVPLAPPVIAGLINLRGHIIITIDLRKRLRFQERPSDGEVMSIVIRTLDGEVNLLVDKIGGVIEVRPDLFEPPPSTLDRHLQEVVKGIYKLNEQLLLALDTEVLSQITESVGG